MAMHLAGQWATAIGGGATALICHHELMRQQMERQLLLEIPHANVNIAGEGASWLMVDGDERVLVATIDGLLDLVLEGEDRWDYWLWWLKTRGLFSAITELQHMPFWAEPRGFSYIKDYVKILSSLVHLNNDHHFYNCP